MNNGNWRSAFNSYAQDVVPTNYRDALDWCQQQYEDNGTYRSAAGRIVSYFATDFEIGGIGQESIGDDEREKWTTQLSDHMDVLGAEQVSGLTRMCFGNSYSSVVVGFTRFLVCPKCRLQITLRTAYENSEFKFKFTPGYDFHAECPKCKYSGEWQVKDETNLSPDKVSIKHWPPQEIWVLHDIGSGDNSYLWKIPEAYKRELREGRLFHLERVQKSVLDTIKKNQLFQFRPDVIFHSKEPHIATRENRGVGLSRLMTNHKQLWYVELLRRRNEVQALDYLIPVRVVTPAAIPTGGPSTDDMLKRYNLQDFGIKFRQMIGNHRRNPSTWSYFPLPLQSQMLGADPNMMVTPQLLTQAEDTFLNSCDVPTDMYRGTMQAEVAIPGLRLFEAVHQNIPYTNNRFLRWVCKRIVDIFGWEAVRAVHRRVTLTDDIAKQSYILQAAAAGDISKTRAMRLLGTEWRDEQRQLMDEARFKSEQDARLQKEMEQASFGDDLVARTSPQAQMAGQAGGQAAGGEQPTAPALPSQSLDPMSLATPQDMQQTAIGIANELLAMPANTRRSELQAIKSKNEALHGLVTSEMQKIRSQARSQGGAAMMQQQYGTA